MSRAASTDVTPIRDVKSVPDQVRGAIVALAMDTRCSEADRAALRALAEHGTEFMLIRLRALLR